MSPVDILAAAFKYLPLAIGGSVYLLPTFMATVFGVKWIFGIPILLSSIIFVSIFAAIIWYQETSARNFRAKPSSDGKDTCLITGGSTGIGFELAKLFAKDGFNLILVARDEDKLNNAKNELLRINSQIKVFTISKDLGDVNVPKEIFNQIMKGSQFKGLRTRFLINNAGFSLRGRFMDIPLNTLIQEVNVNDTNLMQMCHLFGNKWQQELKEDENLSFRIMNLSAFPAFLPTPFQTVYTGSKSFVHTFTLALHEEISPMWNGRFTATVLCPSLTDTDLIKKMKADTSNVVEVFKMLDDPALVAKFGYHGMFNGERLVFVGWYNRIMSWVMTCVLPMWFVLKLSKFSVSDKKETLANPKLLFTKGFSVERGNYAESEISMQ